MCEGRGRGGEEVSKKQLLRQWKVTSLLAFPIATNEGSRRRRRRRRRQGEDEDEEDEAEEEAQSCS